MKHIDILIHVLCLFSGILTAVLGFLLYMKYKLRVLRNYSFFILSTTFTVTITTLYSYISYYVGISQNQFTISSGDVIFSIFLGLINQAFIMFVMEMIEKPVTVLNRIWIFIPWILIASSIALLAYFRVSNGGGKFSRVFNLSESLVLLCLFASFIIYSIRIYVNLKFIDNLDLKRALKVLALLFIIYIPIQAFIISLLKDTVIIFLSRNIFYLLVNIISILFAARYFFMETPPITGPVIISDHFISLYAITVREKEVIGLLLSGLSIKEIGGKLGRSFKTVNNHIYNIYKKVNVSSKMELLNMIKDINL